MHLDLKNIPLPPVHHLLGGTIEQVQDDEALKIRLSYQPRVEFSNPMGNLQGGIVCSMLDDAMGLLTHMLQEGEACTTVNMNISFLRRCMIADLEIEAYAVRQGKRICNVESIAYQQGKAVAKASAVFMRI